MREHLYNYMFGDAGQLCTYFTTFSQKGLSKHSGDQSDGSEKARAQFQVIYYIVFIKMKSK